MAKLTKSQVINRLKAGDYMHAYIFLSNLLLYLFLTNPNPKQIIVFHVYCSQKLNVTLKVNPKKIRFWFVLAETGIVNELEQNTVTDCSNALKHQPEKVLETSPYSCCLETPLDLSLTQLAQFRLGTSSEGSERSYKNIYFTQIYYFLHILRRKQ